MLPKLCIKQTESEIILRSTVWDDAFTCTNCVSDNNSVVCEWNGKIWFFVTFSPNMGYQSMEQKTTEILDIVIVII